MTWCSMSRPSERVRAAICGTGTDSGELAPWDEGYEDQAEKEFKPTKRTVDVDWLGYQVDPVKYVQLMRVFAAIEMDAPDYANDHLLPWLLAQEHPLINVEYDRVKATLDLIRSQAEQNPEPKPEKQRRSFGEWLDGFLFNPITLRRRQ